MATKYTRTDRYKAAAALVATSNSKAASRESGIPASTIRHWSQNDDDFQMMCHEIWSEFGAKMRPKLAEIIDESADQILDRIRNGDVIRDTKTGNLIRIPIKGRDLAIIGGVAFDKLRLAENQPTSISGNTGGTQALIKKFDDLANKWDEKQVNVVKTQDDTEEIG